MSCSLSIILPTIGRPTLAQTLESIGHQTHVPGDEVLLIGDGISVESLIPTTFPIPIRPLSHGPTRNYGNDQRTFGARWAHGDWLSYMDDDDIYTKDAFIKIRKACANLSKRKFLVFKVVQPWGEVVWTDQSIEQGNLCTLQLVVPNVRKILPPWGPRQGANVPFFRALTRIATPHWRHEIIAIARPKVEDLWWK